MSGHVSNVNELLAQFARLTGPVVVGFDGSDAARGAVQLAAAEAQARSVPLRIVVATTIVATDFGYGTADTIDPGMMDAIRVGAQREVAAVVDDVTGQFPGLAVHGIADVGSAAAVLLDNSTDASAIVVGSRGSGGFLGHLLGGTARQLASHSPVPTIVVRRPTPVGDRVVVGVDGSADSMRALAYAFDFADRHHLDLTVMHTWDVPPIGALTGVPGPESADQIRSMADDEARWAAEELVGFSEHFPSVAVTQKVLQGSPVRVLVAESEQAALLVVGSRGRGGFLGLLLGSVSHGVLHHASCNVAVVSGRT